MWGRRLVEMPDGMAVKPRRRSPWGGRGGMEERVGGGGGGGDS